MVDEIVRKILRRLRMIVGNDQVEKMVNSLHEFNAQEVRYKFDIEKNGEQFTFEIRLKRKEEKSDE